MSLTESKRIIGVTKGNGKWVARITVKGKSIWLGAYKDEASAISARKKANKEYNYRDKLSEDTRVAGDKRINRNNSKLSLLLRMYSGQKYRSKNKNYGEVGYTKDEFINWMLLNDDFIKLYKVWKLSNFEKMLIPTCDRIDDYKPYSFSNIQVINWHDNDEKGRFDRINGINNKASKRIAKFSKDGVYIKTYNSINLAKRENGYKNASNISSVAIGDRMTAYGFIWRYA